ncbi:siroheme synthase CysG [Parvularcula dongshanensis]|uniref:Uroporphyrin-III C-methyltransferase/precorrin-2 dehydrogenase/sirohydrochlorin ferrochelatase n=1 Tax=Parvularcula dongshanensis TaxID=1173995 RepID=A0A840I233_9PROT|nr:siroheme synthase CysG [Parvularcula dongshanensis]MBB4658120.1 uroporphyrin-III C-methyltransferase/precorrin-2 dehydrogenase/sirohydrochlorin ferrochelatase [Parvularcula dongshanensis]
MRFFPAFFDLQGRDVWISGGGALAARKARLVLKAGARVTFWSAGEDAEVRAEFGEACAYRARPIGVLRPRPALLIAATGDEGQDGRAAAIARAAGVPVNAVDQPQSCDFVVPSIVERGDVTIGISTGGAAPVIGRRLRERIEALLPARLGELVAFAGSKRSRVAEEVAPEARRGFWERVLAGPVAEAVLDGDLGRAEAGFDRAVAKAGRPEGHVAIVGAGPGDPELLTLKALRFLQEADVVLYDNLVGEGVLDLIRRDAERRYVGKRRADHSLPQEDIGALMVGLAREGKRVVRLKGGDPYVFGRGGEELDALRAAGLSATVVPGITAAAGCGASASVPLTHRGLSQAVTFVTAQGGNGGAPGIDWSALAQLKHTIVVYMGVAKAGEVSRNLGAGGLSGDTPVAVVEKGTLPDQKIVPTTLRALPDDVALAGITGPAVLIIGEVAARADGPGLLDLAMRDAAAERAETAVPGGRPVAEGVRLKEFT